MALYRCGALIGRFQPFHLGHLYAVKYALKKVKRLLVVVGSAQFSYTWRNPFTAGERIEMIWRSLKREGLLNDSLLLIPVDDTYERNYIWVRHVENYVPPFKVVFSNDPLTIQLFKEANYEVLEVPLFNRGEVSGTRIRGLMAKGGEWQKYVPSGTLEVLKEINGEHRIKTIFKYV